MVAYSASRSTKLTKVTFDLNCIMLVSFMSRQIDLYACFVVAFITFETFCLQMLSFNMVFHVRNAIVCVIASPLEFLMVKPTYAKPGHQTPGSPNQLKKGALVGSEHCWSAWSLFLLLLQFAKFEN